MTLHHRPTDGESTAISLERWSRATCLFEFWNGVQPAVLQKEKGVAVQDVRSAFGDHIDSATGSATVFGGPSVGHDLELAHDLQRQFGPAAAAVFVVVVETVNGQHVAARAQSAKAESTVQ